jgi:disulfide bond formation protein DsbB
MKKALQIFCVTNECDSDSKKWRFLLKQRVTKKMCGTNKNVIKMGVIIMIVFCINLIAVFFYQIQNSFY